MIADSRLKKMVAEAVIKLHTLNITYKKKDGKIVRRRIEPYEIKTEKVKDDYGYMKPVEFLYGHDISSSVPIKKRTMKRWITKNFLSMVIEQGTTFKPRY